MRPLGCQPVGPLRAAIFAAELSSSLADTTGDRPLDPRFAQLVEHLAPKLDALMASTVAKGGPLPRELPVSGVYLFSELGRHLYVGRSNNLRRRYGRHCLPSATGRQAAFAFHLAREHTGRTSPSYRSGPQSRDGLMLDPEFAAAFDRAKARIR